MGKHLLRKDTECQNCGYAVDKNYCPNCGQKNTETRQSFHHLFTHFIEDLTHYDTAFWKTIKYLLFRPAKLTTEYLQGKRQSYVPPVKLYIFISFITFLIIALLPDAPAKHKKQTIHPKDSIKVQQPRIDVAEDVYPNMIFEDEFQIINPLTYKTVRQMDSVEALKPDSLKLDYMERKMAKRLISIYEHNTPRQVGEKFATSLGHNIPKALFVYLPIFAFWLWLFHGKKRWLYFDHGIFTLHYFSFLLLTTVFISCLQKVAEFVNNGILILGLIFMILCILLWQIYYFFRAHRKMYREHIIINFLKGVILFFINITAIISILVIFGFLTLYNLH